jgi:hypothetical protein
MGCQSNLTAKSKTANNFLGDTLSIKLSRSLAQISCSFCESSDSVGDTKPLPDEASCIRCVVSIRWLLLSVGLHLSVGSKDPTTRRFEAKLRWTVTYFFEFISVPALRDNSVND